MIIKSKEIIGNYIRLLKIMCGSSKQGQRIEEGYQIDEGLALRSFCYVSRSTGKLRNEVRMLSKLVA